MHSVLLLALSASSVAVVPERSRGDLVVLLSMACGYLFQSKDIISLLRKKAVMQRVVVGITKGQAVTYTLSDGKKIQKVTDVVTGTGSVVRAVSFQHR